MRARQRPEFAVPGVSAWLIRALAIVAIWVAAAAVDAYLWRGGSGVIHGALGAGFATVDATVKCDGPVVARADLNSREVRFRCQLALGGLWPFFTEFRSPQLESIFLAPLDRRLPQRVGASG